jgi:hypothetical protein
MPADDLLTNQSGEDEMQDQFLQELRHIAGRPDPSLMQDYRLPIKQDIDFQLNTSEGELQEVSSDESEKDGSQSGKEEEHKKNEEPEED